MLIGGILTNLPGCPGGLIGYQPCESTALDVNERGQVVADANDGYSMPGLDKVVLLMPLGPQAGVGSVNPARHPPAG